MGTVVVQLARQAKRLKLAVAIESLDFSTKKLMARAGRVNKRYNDMLGSLPSSQFEEMVSRACEREHLMLYSVNPLYSSVGGFAKYRRSNRMNADTSAALWIGRQALFGEIGSTEPKDTPTRATVKHVDERLVFSHLPATPMQSMTALAGAQWRDVAWGLGSNRKLWGLKLRRWFDLRVEAASRSLRKVTPQHLGEIIDQIFHERLEDGQLDEAPLTLLEISKIKSSFTFTLLNMLHARVAYPAADEGDAARSSGAGSA